MALPAFSVERLADCDDGRALTICDIAREQVAVAAAAAATAAATAAAGAEAADEELLVVEEPAAAAAAEPVEAAVAMECDAQ